MEDSNDDLRKDEIRSLEAIYAIDDFKVYGTSCISLQVKVDEAFVQISCDIPKGYPTTAAPSFKLKPKLANEEDLQALLAPVLNTDQVCIFQAIEAIRSYLQTLPTKTTIPSPKPSQLALTIHHGGKLCSVRPLF